MSVKGRKMSPESCAKMSASRKGRTIPPEVRAKISANSAKVWLGKTLPPHVVQQMCERRKGVTPWNKGKRGEYKQPASNGEATRKRMTGLRLGSDNPMWNGGTTPVRARLWFSAPYQAWRTGVFERDNYTCQMCGVKNERGAGFTIRLEADHYPVPFAAHLNRIKASVGVHALFDAAMQDAELWSTQGRTLCSKCHNTTKRGRATVLRSQEEEARLAR